MNSPLKALFILLKKLLINNMISLRVVWMSLEEIIEICSNELFKEPETVEGLSKTEFKELLSLATKNWHFIFDGTLYKQIDGVAMDSPLGPTLANASLVYCEKIWLEHCLLENIDHYTIEDMLMVYLFYLIHQNILNAFIVT